MSIYLPHYWYVAAFDATLDKLHLLTNPGCRGWFSCIDVNMSLSKAYLELRSGVSEAQDGP